MRLLLVSDVHYRLRQYDWLYEMAGQVDLVVVAGDLLDIRSAVAIPAQAAAISAQLARISTQGRIIAASGNHDLDELDVHGEKFAGWLRRLGTQTLSVDFEQVDVGDVRVSAYGWWDGEHGRVETEQRMREAARTRPGTWTWVYHSPPTGSPLAWDGRREFGDDQLLGWIEEFQPELVCSGHIHQSPFVDGGGWIDQVGSTWIFNAGQQIGHVPAHVMIDLDEGTATWFSATDRETVRLREPFVRPVPAK